jgi:hypothetical protein
VPSKLVRPLKKSLPVLAERPGDLATALHRLAQGDGGGVHDAAGARGAELFVRPVVADWSLRFRHHGLQTLRGMPVSLPHDRPAALSNLSNRRGM